MTAYFDGPLVGFDIESTGVDQFEDRIVTFSAIYSESAEADPHILEWLMDPGIEIDPGASEVHGITTEHAREYGRNPAECLQEIANKLVSTRLLGIPFVIYNATFDTTMLWAEFERYGTEIKYDKAEFFQYVIDPLVIDKATDKYRKGSRKLTDTAKLLGYDLTNAHESTADVLATLFVARKMKGRFNEGMTLELLQEFQRDAKLEQATSFQAYLRKKENDDTIVINTEWPYQTNKG